MSLKSSQPTSKALISRTGVIKNLAFLIIHWSNKYFEYIQLPAEFYLVSKVPINYVLNITLAIKLSLSDAISILLVELCSRFECVRFYGDQ